MGRLQNFLVHHLGRLDTVFLVLQAAKDRKGCFSTIKSRALESSLTGGPSLGQARHPLQRQNHLQCDDGAGNIAAAGGIVEALATWRHVSRSRQPASRCRATICDFLAQIIAPLFATHELAHSGCSSSARRRAGHFRERASETTVTLHRHWAFAKEIATPSANSPLAFVLSALISTCGLNG
jgi:hypothetical protein